MMLSWLQLISDSDTLLGITHNTDIEKGFTKITYNTDIEKGVY